MTLEQLGAAIEETNRSIKSLEARAKARISGREIVTIDERIERLEHITHGWIEQTRKELEEDRRLWREQRDEIAAIWRATDRRFDEMRRDARDEMTEMRRQTAERDRITDKRIGDLVGAIADLCRKMDNKL